MLLGANTAGVVGGDELAARLRREPGVTGVAPFTYAKAMLFRDGVTEGLVVKGVDLKAERSVTTIGAHIRPALEDIPLGSDGREPGIVLGSELASRMGVSLGQVVLLATLRADASSAFGWAPRLKPFRLVGVFTSGLYTYDSSFGFVAIGSAQDFFELGDRVTGVEVRLADMFDAPEASKRLVAAAGRSDLRANNWMDLNRNLFTWMKLEKAVMFLILALIVLVAAFNIVSTLFMVVMEKRLDIGVLKTMGATPQFVLRIFLVEGLLIGGLGTALGTGLGAALIWVLERYPFVRLPGDVYFIETLPVRAEAGDFAAVILAALALCIAAAWYPAWQAARIDPIAAIRKPV